MNKVLLRLKDLPTSKIYEVYFDDRLSFKENFQLLSKMINEDLTNRYVYDASKNIFLDNEIPIHNFRISIFTMFFLV